MRKTFIVLLIGLLFFGRAARSRADQVAPPTFIPAAGTYQHGIAVEIHCSTQGAQIYYTTDGSTPTRASILYRGTPVVITNHASVNHDPDPADTYAPLTTVSRTIKAVAVEDGWSDSPTASADFVIDKVAHYFDLPYAAPPDGCAQKHLLDVYQPLGLTNTPVLFFVHGGGWTTGDKNIYLELGNTYAGDYQFTAVVINYRLTDQECGYVHHPAHIEDVAAAFQWVVNNIATYGGDPNNVHIFGQSAGGHLVSLLATDPRYLAHVGVPTDKIRSVTTMSGAYNLSDFVQDHNNPLGLADSEILGYKALFLLVFGNLLPQTLLDASPGQHVNTDQPPFHIISLEESDTFHDMPGFVSEAGQFYSQVSGLSGPPVALQYLTESDIPPQVLALDFPDFAGEDVDGHYEEIYAINTTSWDSASTSMVAEYVEAQSPLDLTWPDGGEVLFSGSRQTITWNSAAGIAAVKLEYSTDDGATWSTIADSAPSTGSYVWQVPGLASWLTRIRVSEASSGRPMDMSALVFTIGSPYRLYLPVAQVRGGE